ncbi:MAG: ABC transporter permease subunit [Erysipelotrichaceae bacterium]|nr:ABC transporter permease subunit [Erysipelotrichaceae bacterium]
MKKKCLTCFILIVLWQMTSLIVDKEVILPFPSDVFLRMLDYLTISLFYFSVFSTLLRIFISFILAMLIGVSLGIWAGLNHHVYELLEPIMALLQTIPQIGYILILLVWLNSLQALIVIVMLMILPLFYHNTVSGIQHIDRDLKDVIVLYHHSLCFNLRYAYLPLIGGYLASAISSALPMAFKVGVMAEIFVSSRQGIGKLLYNARVNFDMTSIFALILWMVIILMLINLITDTIIKYLHGRHH